MTLCRADGGTKGAEASSTGTIRTLAVGMLAMLLATIGLSASATAYSGRFAAFDDCPLSNPVVKKCLHALTTGGTVILGKKTTPIVNPVVLSGGLSKEMEVAIAFGGAKEISYPMEIIPPINGPVLSKTPQPVPGGLLGLVAPSSSPAVKQLMAYYVEHNLTQVNAVLEVVPPSGESLIGRPLLSTLDLITGGVVAHLPVKFHLENPFLGSSCYIGSNAAPIMVNLEPGPQASIPGYVSIVEEFEIVGTFNQIIGDNAWAAPAASGCGGALAPLVDPLLDAATGLPSPAGRNSVIVMGHNEISNRASVLGHP